MSLNEDHSRAVRARKCNSNYRQGWDESLTQESRHPKVGPSHREVVTKFGSHLFPRDADVPRKIAHPSNELRGSGVFCGARVSNLQSGLIPGKKLGRSDVLGSSSKASEYSSFHPPPSARGTAMVTSRTSNPATSTSPYAWNPSNPDSSSYGFNRRW